MSIDWIERLSADTRSRAIVEQERLLVEVTESIAALMSQLDVHRSELAKRIGRSPAYVTKILRGDNNFTLRTLSDVFFALGRSVHLSLGDPGCEVSPPSTKQSQPLKLNAAAWMQNDWGQIKYTGHPRLVNRSSGDKVA